MAHFETETGKSDTPDLTEIIELKDYQVTVRFIADGVTQVLPVSWIDVQAPLQDSDGNTQHAAAASTPEMPSTAGDTVDAASSGRGYTSQPQTTYLSESLKPT